MSTVLFGSWLFTAKLLGLKSSGPFIRGWHGSKTKNLSSPATGCTDRKARREFWPSVAGPRDWKYNGLSREVVITQQSVSQPSKEWRGRVASGLAREEGPRHRKRIMNELVSKTRCGIWSRAPDTWIWPIELTCSSWSSIKHLHMAPAFTDGVVPCYLILLTTYL